MHTPLAVIFKSKQPPLPLLGSMGRELYIVQASTSVVFECALEEQLWSGVVLDEAIRFFIATGLLNSFAC